MEPIGAELYVLSSQVKMILVIYMQAYIKRQACEMLGYWECLNYDDNVSLKECWLLNNALSWSHESDLLEKDVCHIRGQQEN